MQISDEQRRQILTRLRRVEGQIRGIQGMIESDDDCGDVITQFSAALKALERSAFKYFSANLALCAQRPEEADAQGYTAEKLEKIFLQLA